MQVRSLDEESDTYYSDEYDADGYDADESEGEEEMLSRKRVSFLDTPRADFRGYFHGGVSRAFAPAPVEPKEVPIGTYREDPYPPRVWSVYIGDYGRPRYTLRNYTTNGYAIQPTAAYVLRSDEWMVADWEDLQDNIQWNQRALAAGANTSEYRLIHYVFNTYFKKANGRLNLLGAPWVSFADSDTNYSLWHGFEFGQQTTQKSQLDVRSEQDVGRSAAKILHLHAILKRAGAKADEALNDWMGSAAVGSPDDTQNHVDQTLIRLWNTMREAVGDLIKSRIGIPSTISTMLEKGQFEDEILHRFGWRVTVDEENHAQIQWGRVKLENQLTELMGKGKKEAAQQLISWETKELGKYGEEFIRRLENDGGKASRATSDLGEGADERPDEGEEAEQQASSK
ncbi:hypothetical protein CLAIMM_14719 [Cladophialophora immunda]|nr:hypothetical protein CLAIMM_14719 [Cladophialophora immunda]